MPKFRSLGVIVTLGLVLAACQGGGGTQGADGGGGEGTAAATQDGGGGEVPEEIVIGFVPSREAGTLVETVEPLADYLSEELDIPVRGVVSNDYTGLVTAMQTGQAHIGAFGPVALLQAVEQADAEIILQSERNGSATYHTQFFTTDADRYCEDEPVENERTVDDEPVTFLNCNGTERGPEDSPEGPIGIEALANVEPETNVAFVEATSASGYVFPATIFANAGLDPEADINPVFAGSHDASVIAVCEGRADVGVSFDDARTIAVTDCDVPGTVVVFAYGPEIPNDGIAVSGDLPQELRDAIKQALLDFAETEEGSATLDEIYQISALTEPDLESLEIVRDAVEQLGVTE